MVYLAELLAVMTAGSGLKIVRILARCVVPVHGHKHLESNAFLVSLSRSRKATVLCSRCAVRWGAVLLKHKKTHPETTCAYIAVASEQKGCRDSMPVHCDTKSEQSDCNKSSVR